VSGWAPAPFSESDTTIPTPQPAPQPIYLKLPLARPLWVYVLVGACVAVFVAMTLAGGSERVSVLVRFGAKVNSRILQGEYWRFFTPMFLHIGLLHLVFNGWALVAIGRDVERVYGRARFLVIYFFSGVAATVVSFASTTAISAGASGAIFGLLGAIGVFYLIHRRALGRAGRGQLVNILVVAAFNLVYGSLAAGIDNAAHVGGLVSGVALGLLLCPRYQVSALFDGPRLVDINPLSRRWAAVALAVVLLIALAAAAVGMRGGTRLV
jgi:rhomboid protease GluP